jgi:hypothetical protein
MIEIKSNSDEKIKYNLSNDIYGYRLRTLHWSDKKEEWRTNRDEYPGNLEQAFWMIFSKEIDLDEHDEIKEVLIEIRRTKKMIKEKIENLKKGDLL